MHEQDPKHLRNSHIVGQAAANWLRERGMDFSMRDVIRSSHKLHEVSRNIEKKRRLERREFEEEMKIYEDQTDVYPDSEIEQ